MIIEKQILALNKAMYQAREWIEKLGVVLKIKRAVLGREPHTLQLNTDIDEILIKMKNYDYLSVVISEKNDSFFPVGIVKAKDLRETPLATISLRTLAT